MILYIFLSHDVDWRKQGPEKEHIFARKDRFENSIFERVYQENLYYNFEEIMDLEEKFNIRSTFFFRTYYENGNYLDYEEEITSLIKGKWEIGLHTDGNSIRNLDLIQKEKTNLEILTKKAIVGKNTRIILVLMI
jgi:peptidoglycan/xylan/chitin deacetylase (PgdA/CDA1 family)